MRLDHECVRKLLLYYESNLTLTDSNNVDGIDLSGFSAETVKYTTLKLAEAHFVDASVTPLLNGDYYVTVKAITWDGHAYLDTVRDNAVWKKTKSILSGVSSASVEIISNVASNVITNMICQPPPA